MSKGGYLAKNALIRKQLSSEMPHPHMKSAPKLNRTPC